MSDKMKKSIILIIACLLILSVYFIIKWHVSEQKANLGTFSEKKTEKKPINFEFKWQKNKTYIYDFVFSGLQETINKVETSTKVSQTENSKFITGDLELSASLKFHSHGKKDGKNIITVELTDFKKHTFIFNNKNIFEDKRILDYIFINNKCMIELENSGKISSLRFKSDTDDTFKNIFQMLLSEIQVVILNNHVKWTNEEKTNNGTYKAEYEYMNSENNELLVEKLYLDYSPPNYLKENSHNLMSNYEIILNPNGYLDSLIGVKAIQTKRKDGKPTMNLNNNISLKFVEIKKTELLNPNDVLDNYNENRKLEEVVFSEKARKRMINQRLEGMNETVMINGILDYGKTGAINNLSEWLWKAVGLLENNPELCLKLIPVFKNKELGGKGRTLLIDLLANAGHETAQKALTTLLKDSSLFKDEKEFSILIQRMLLIGKPSINTLTFLNDKYSNSTGHIKIASSYTLGSSISKLYDSGEKELALEYNKYLIDDLHNADNAKDKSHLLEAIGNANLEENTEVVLSYKDDQDNVVRASVANALRSSKSVEAQNAVFDFLTDQDRFVQSSALQTIRYYNVNSNQLNRLKNAIETEKINQNNYPDLLNIISDNANKDINCVKDTLQELKNQNISNKDLRTRINTMLIRYKESEIQ